MIPQSLMYEVSHPDAPGKKNYLLATSDMDSQSHQEKICQKIASSALFSKASMLVTQSPCLVESINNKASDFIGWGRDQVVEFMKWMDALTSDESNYDAVNQEGDVRTFAINTNKGVFNFNPDMSDGLKYLAGHHRQEKLEIVALESHKEFFKERLGGKLKRVSSTYPDLVLLAAPVLPLRDAIHAPWEKHKLKQSYKAYKAGDVDKLLKISKNYSNVDQDKISQRVSDWMTIGYQGESDNPSKGGIIALLKQGENAVVALHALYLFHENGVLQQLENAGFELKPLAWNKLDTLQEAALVEEVSNTF